MSYLKKEVKFLIREIRSLQKNKKLDGDESERLVKSLKGLFQAVNNKGYKKARVHIQKILDVIIKKI